MLHGPEGCAVVSLVTSRFRGHSLFILHIFFDREAKILSGFRALLNALSSVHE